MCEIKKTQIEKGDKFTVDKPQWGYDKYIPKVYAQIVYDDSAFYVKYTAYEKNPRREKQNNFEYVNEDSCVEFFANFMPDTSEYYFNFEFNANAIVNFSFRKNRYEFIKLTEEDAEALEAKAQIYDDKWVVDYKIPFTLLSKYYGSFDISKCTKIKGNLFKCGDKTEIEHYLAHFNINSDIPDYHLPQYFGEISVK